MFRIFLLFLVVALDVPCLFSFFLVPRGMITTTINTRHFKNLFATKDTTTEVELKLRLMAIEKEKEEIERLIKVAKKTEKLEEKAAKVK